MDDLQQTSPRPADLGPSPKISAQPRHRSLEMERAYLRALVGPEFRPVLGMVLITLSVGTIFYRLVEHWTLLNSLYFSVVTLATIGFGDLAPATRIGKIFTIFYVFVGVGTLGLFLSAVARTSARSALLQHDMGVRSQSDEASDEL